MPEKQYLIPYAPDVRKRHHHKTERGKVVWFMVQLEVLSKGEWKPVIRYDCAHGYAHCDRYNLEGGCLKGNISMSYEDALTFSDDDIDDRWQVYRSDFLKGGSP